MLLALGEASGCGCGGNCASAARNCGAPLPTRPHGPMHAGVAATCLPGASPNAVSCMILQVADAGKDPALVATLAAMLDGVGSGLGYSGRHGLLRRLLDRLVQAVHGAGLAPERLLWVMQGLGVDARDSLALDSVAVGAWAQFPDVLREEVGGRVVAARGVLQGLGDMGG